MENKSRVILYKELRDKIANRDTYSFEETKTRKKHLPSSLPKTKEEKKEPSSNTPVVTTSTLSLSVEELRKAKDELDKKQMEEETKKLYLEKHKKEKKEKTLKRVFLSLALAAVLAVVILIIVFVWKGSRR